MFRLKLLFKNKKFWISSFGIWGVIWSVAEGLLFSLQLAQIIADRKLGFVILLLLVGSIAIGGFVNWPLRTRTRTIKSTGVRISLKFGNIWKEKGEKVIAVTRCFSTEVDDIVIHSKTLHGMFIKRNFQDNTEAKAIIDDALERTGEEDFALQEPGKTIKIEGEKDDVFLVGLTVLDVNNMASVTPENYFIALANIWESIKKFNGGTSIICPLIGSGRSRLNFNNTAIFYELLNSVLIAMKSGFITNELIFMIHPEDIKTEKVNIDELENILTTLCELENLDRMTFAGHALEIPV